MIEVIKKVVCYLGNVGRQEDMRDSVLQFTMNIFTGSRTQEPESGKNLKLLTTW